jgi:hypothetical protein
VDPGDLCSVAWGDADYRVVKILSIGDGLLHVRLYADRFVDRPLDVEASELELAHLPLSAEDFAAWAPEVIGHAPVEPDELEWVEADRALLR